MFRGLYDWTLRWAGSRHAGTAMGIVSFVESSVFPVPADVIFIPMCLSRPERAWRYAAIATVTSVLGGILGWTIGFYFFDLIAQPVLQFYGKEAAFADLRATTGDGAILLMLVTSGLTHLPPMKLVTILAGVVAFDLKWFVISAILARGARFYLLAWALRRYGQTAVDFLSRRFVAVLGAVSVAAVLVYLLIKLL